MFWKKKQLSVSPVIEGAPSDKTLGGSGGAASQQKVEGSKAAKLSGPKMIPGLVEKYITTTYKMDSSIIQFLKMVIRKRANAERAFDCRVYDTSEAEALDLQVKDYNSLDSHTELILFEGWFDEQSKQVELSEKKKMNSDIPLLTEAEISQKIEALTEPGSSVYFYQNSGPAAGGPLGRGAAIVELNPDYSKKKGKKYTIYTANVIGMEPLPKRNKLYGADKPKEIAKWIAQAHKKRAY